MAKILISPLGAGSRDKNNKAEREYKPANYKIDDKTYKKSFIASVLYEHFQFDGIIFVGTVKSMWEEVYKVFSEEKGNQINQEYYFELAEKIDQLNHESSLEELNLSCIEEVLGQSSKCLLINYGLNEQEIQENLDIILSIIDNFQQNDQIYIDITHSFRSLSIFLFLVLMFVSDLVKDKNIQIKGIYYGMLDVTTELGYTPVVNLQSLFDLTQWIKGAYSLKEFGNGYLISQLLQKEGEENLANRIQQLSDIININYLPSIRQSTIDLNTALKQKGASEKTPFKYLKSILEKFIEQFTKEERECDFQLRLAKWYFDNKRYATGYITLTESIITYLCETYDKDPKSEKDRNEMKDLLHESENFELSQIYFEVNPIRKNIAHALIDQKRKNHTSAIDNAEKLYQNTKRVFKTGTLGQNKPRK